MAHKKAAWSAKNLRDSNPKYRGLKLAWGQQATAWNIIIRQKGDKYECGRNTYKGKDFTIHARVDGIVSFRKKKFMRFDGRKYLKTVVDIVPMDEVVTTKPTAKKAPAKKAAPVKAAAKTEAKATPAKKAPVKKAAPAKTTKAKAASTGGDDLTKIEGVGPKINELFQANGIKTFADLSSSKVGDLRTLLADNDLAMHDPKTWKKQATLAKNGKWDELKVLQEELDWGK